MIGARVKRRVLVLNHFAVPRSGAGGTRHVELFGRLVNWDYTLIAADRNLFTRQRFARAGSMLTVPTTPYRSNGILRILNWASYAVGAFVRGLLIRRVDLVYASSPHLLTGLAGWAVARIRRAPFVVEVRDLWPEVLVAMRRIEPTSRLFRLLHRLEVFLYRAADRIVVLAAGSAAAISSLGIAGDKITLIPNGAEPADFAVSASREALRERFGFTEMVFLYAGAHGPANGLDLLVDAAQEIQSVLPNVRFVLVGDGPIKPQLQRRVEFEHVLNVRFMDPVPKADMPELLAAADVGVHVLADVPLFRYGVSPNKLFDYMAAGLPVLTNCPGEVADTVEAARCGVAVQPDEIAQGVGIIATAAPDQLSDWGRAARSYMAETHSRQLLARLLENTLDCLAARGS